MQPRMQAAAGARGREGTAHRQKETKTEGSMAPPRGASASASRYSASVLLRRPVPKRAPMMTASMSQFFS